LRFNASTFPGPGGIPTISRLLGNPSFRSEDLLAYELGYRLQAERRFSFDLAAFYNAYDHLRTSEPGSPYFEPNPAPAHLVFPLVFDNRMNGKTYGLELASNWSIAEHWRLIPSYTWLQLDMTLDPTSHDTRSLAVEGESPRHQVQMRSNLDLTRRLQLDASVFYTGALPAFLIPGYTRMDARLGYRPRSDLEFSLTGQNLQGGRHQEFASNGIASRAAIGRSFMLKVTLGF
jgi:iron complex outermembrane receptor protein